MHKVGNCIRMQYGCIYTGLVRDNDPSVSSVIDIHRELQALLRMKMSLGFGDVKNMQTFNMYFSDCFCVLSIRHFFV